MSAGKREVGIEKVCFSKLKLELEDAYWGGPIPQKRSLFNYLIESM